jgi:hypothetical protein
MDPMDFTMDEAQASHHSPNAAHRHQCQPSQSSNSNSFGSPHIRNGPPYDPVYDSSAWYHANNVPSRGPYNAPEHVHWGASPFLPTPNWQSHGLAEHSGQDPTAFRQSRFMGMPWNEMRAFDPPGFGFNSYTSPPNSNNATSDSTGGSAQAATGPRVPSTYGQEAHARSAQHAFQIYGQGRSNRFTGPDSTQRRDDVAERSIRSNQPMSFMEQRTSYPRTSRQSHIHVPRNNAFEPPHSRRRA